MRRFVLCNSVENREPVGPAEAFPRSRDGKIWAFVEAASLHADREAEIAVTFASLDRPGAAPPPVLLAIRPGARYRTWARATAWRSPGRYEAIVRDAAGNVLARRPFSVVE